MTPTSQLRPVLAFVLLCLVWGSSYLFIRLGIKQLSPVSLVGMRLFIGALTIGVVATLRRQPLRLARRDFGLLLVLATINTTVPFLLISWGEETVPSGLASVLNSTVPIFSVILAGLLLADEPITAAKLSGVVIGFGGVVLLLSRDLAHGSLHASGLGGQLAIILSSVCYAAGAVFIRRTLRHVPSLTLAVYVLGISATEAVALSAIASRPALGSLDAQTWVSVLWLGILGSGLAYVLAYYVLANWGAARYTLVAYALQVVGLVLGVIVLGERIDWRIGAGSALVVAGIGLAGLVRRRPEGARANNQINAEPDIAASG
jgi:drug/metabolite transporter (DMT)-like permease